MTMRITRRSYLLGRAALAGAALSPFGAWAQGAAPLAYKGELSIVGLQRNPPDKAFEAIVADGYKGFRFEANVATAAPKRTAAV